MRLTKKKSLEMALGIKNSWKYEKDLIHILNSILAINAITRLPYLFMTIKKKFLQKKIVTGVSGNT